MGKMSVLSRKQEHAAWIFLLPELSLLAIFVVLPVFMSLQYGFTKYDVLSPAKWIGIRNYVKLLHDDLFWKALRNTLYFSGVTIPIELAIGLILALLLNTKIFLRGFFRSAYFLPVVTPIIATAMVWNFLYNPSAGIFNYFLSSLGLPTQNWLTDPKLAMPSVMAMSIWHEVGFEMIVFLAALQGIPSHLYEAARLDGASKWRCFWHITIPCLKPAFLFVSVMLTIYSFQIFGQIYVMTAGGPANATITVVYNIYMKAFQYLKMGYAASMALVLFVVIFMISFMNIKFFGKEVGY